VQARELERLGCTHAQGYLFSRPLSTQAAEALLVANKPLGPKKVQPADAAAPAGRVPEPLFSSKRFEWPENIPVPRLTAQGSTPRLTDEVRTIPPS